MVNLSTINSFSLLAILLDDDGPDLYLGELVLLGGQLTRHHRLTIAHRL